MPCNSDHMNPHGLEIQLSRVLCLLDERLHGTVIDRHRWVGYHPDAYGKATTLRLSNATAALCALLKVVDVSQYSLEMQMWWRDHQVADAARESKQATLDKEETERQVALAKLTERERQLLGF